MRVDVVFYGGLKQDVGAKQQTVEVRDDVLTVAGLVDVMAQQHPALGPRLSTVAYVVGERGRRAGLRAARRRRGGVTAAGERRVR